MRAAVGFVGVLLGSAGPRRSKRVRVDALNMGGPLGFMGTRQHFGFGDQWIYVQKIVDVGSTERQ